MASGAMVPELYASLLNKSAASLGVYIHVPFAKTAAYIAALGGSVPRRAQPSSTPRP
jgi:hypothetical protein